jgi:hypothetical protein
MIICTRRKLLILLVKFNYSNVYSFYRQMTGSHEVRGSIPLDSINIINNLRATCESCPFYFVCRWYATSEICIDRRSRCFI